MSKEPNSDFDQDADLDAEVQSLRRALMRVSVAADGVAPELDEQLAELRRMVRSGGETHALDTLVEEIAQTLLKLEENKQGRKRAIAVELTDLLDILHSAHLRGDDESRLSRIRRKLQRSPRDQEDAIEETLALLRELLPQMTPDDTADAAPEGGWLGRLIGSGKKGGGTAKEWVSEKIRGTLIKLLNQLNLPDTFSDLARRIRDRLEADLSLDDLPTTIEEITNLVIDSTRVEAAEFENFLHHLTDRLQDIQGFLGSTDSGLDATDHVSDELDQAIRAQVAGIQQSILHTDDLGQLKRRVAGQLDTIVQHMDQFQSQQKAITAQSRQDAESLRTRLTEVENEADHLRTELIQQQVKAQKDSLTELPNREAYIHRLGYEEARWRRYGTPLTLAVADIDHFKSFNDRFGHSTGDKVLKTVAQTLQANLRETDFIARYGGEEFVILMPQTDLNDASNTMEKLRKAVASRPFRSGSERITITLSAGVAQFKESDKGDEVFNRADEALYSAKRNGRDRVHTENDLEQD